MIQIMILFWKVWAFFWGLFSIVLLVWILRVLYLAESKKAEPPGINQEMSGIKDD